MKALDFLKQIPYLCEAKNPERWSKLIELQFNYELENPGSEFSRNKDDLINISNRLETAFGFTGNVDKINHCKKIVELLFLVHYRDYHKEVTIWDSKINQLVDEIKILEVQNTDITLAMNTEQALASRWDGP